MKGIIRFIIFTGILFFNHLLIYSQSGWFPLSSGTSLNIVDIQFVDNNTGYFVANEYITSNSILRKTINGGNTWTSVLTVPYLNRLYFIDVNTGLVVGSLGLIRKTTNGGVSWITQTSPVGGGLNGVKFINTNTGFIAGNSRTILFTTDGGSTWIYRPFGSNDGWWNDVYFFDANTGIVVGNSPTGQSIIKTTDAGLSWNYVTSSIGPISRVAFADNIVGFCVGGGGSIIKTTNSGNNWFSIFNITYGCYGVSVVDINNIIAVGGGGTFGGNGKVVRSTNGGLNWIEQPFGTSKRLWSVSFINSNTGWACGDTGTLVKTTTGGITAIQPISKVIPNYFSLKQSYPNPFNPVTKIRFQIPLLRGVDVPRTWDGRGVLTQLIVYDILGRVTATLLNEQLQPGTYEVEWDAANYPSGVYYYKLSASDYTETKKMVVLK